MNPRLWAFRRQLTDEVVSMTAAGRASELVGQTVNGVLLRRQCTCRLWPSGLGVETDAARQGEAITVALAAERLSANRLRLQVDDCVVLFRPPAPDGTRARQPFRHDQISAPNRMQQQRRKARCGPQQGRCRSVTGRRHSRDLYKPMTQPDRAGPSQPGPLPPVPRIPPETRTPPAGRPWRRRARRSHRRARS